MSQYSLSEHPPTSFRPTNISSRPNPDGMIYVETARPPSDPAPRSNPHPDVAGVLRRNQACLACRRRKLKCDAVSFDIPESSLWLNSDPATLLDMREVV